MHPNLINHPRAGGHNYFGSKPVLNSFIKYLQENQRHSIFFRKLYIIATRKLLKSIRYMVAAQKRETM